MKKILSALLIAILIQQASYSIQDIKKVYLKEAIDAAVENNIDLQTAKLNISIAKNNIKQAARLQNPSFDSMFFTGIAGGDEPKQFGLSQKIEIAKIGARKNLAKSNLNLAKENVNYTKFDLKMDVREAYINLVAAKSVLETLEQQENLQEDLLKIAKSKVKTKQAPETDAIQAEISLNQMVTQVNSAKASVKTALSEFNKIINNPNDILYDSNDNIFSEENNFEEMRTPAPNRSFPDISEFIDEALENRYDLRIAKNEIEVAKKNLTVVSRKRIPDIEVSSGFAYKSGPHSSTGGYSGGAYVAGSLVNIPLLYNYSPEIKNATLKLKQAELNYNSLANKAKKDISASYDKFLISKENLQNYESKILPNSNDLIRASIKAYQQGEADITSLIVMKQSYKSILIGYTYALAEYYNSWTNFLRETNDENFQLESPIVEDDQDEDFTKKKKKKS